MNLLWTIELYNVKALKICWKIVPLVLILTCILEIVNGAMKTSKQNKMCNERTR